jgi:DNA polymerase III sliding clamp (beta) subunit (PCNA family)
VPTEIIFETSVLNDAVQKAARIAPLKGAAADKAAGILFEIDTAKKIALVKATDTEITFIQRIEARETKGEDVKWRLPSMVLQGLLASFPQGQDHTTRMVDRGNDGRLRIVSGKSAVALNMYNASEYPNFQTFDVHLTEANQFASKAERIAWATDQKSKGALSGVHLTGDMLVATNNALLVAVPCEVGITEPITVPLGSLETLLKGGSDVQVAPEADKFYVKLDSDTYATSTIFAMPYPNVQNAFRENFAGTMEIHRASFIDALNRLQAMIRSEREIPTLELTLETEGFSKQLTLDIIVSDLGRMRDGVDVSTPYEDEKVFKYELVPHMLVNALEHTEGTKVFLDFGHAEDRFKDDKTTIRLRDESGWFCYISPRVLGKKAP